MFINNLYQPYQYLKRRKTKITLYEIYYHDAWRSTSSYERQAITMTEEQAEKWLLENKKDWYDENDPEIDDLIEQGLQQQFNYMTVKTIVCNEDGSVSFQQRAQMIGSFLIGSKYDTKI